MSDQFQLRKWLFRTYFNQTRQIEPEILVGDDFGASHIQSELVVEHASEEIDRKCDNNTLNARLLVFG
jgi:hypothetical protein